jgi:hypothetical protein
MKIRDLIKITLGTAILSMVIFSCSDDFSEKDLLQAQYDLASDVRDRNIAALNEAGELVSLQLKVVDTDGVGVAGLDVSMTAAAEGGVGDIQTIVTDAAGLVFFDRVAIGGNSITISGTAIIDAFLNADFGSIQNGVHYQIIEGDIIPTPVTENAVITVLGATPATGTIRGRVEIETDLTNFTSEIPQDLTIIADFNDGLSYDASFNINYFFPTNDNSLNIGNATIDNTTGEYSMTVPAGVNFNIIVPTISTTQRMAIAGVNGDILDVPEYRDVEVNFGPSFGASNIPFIRGARVVFDAPSSGGSGFTLSNLQRVPRDINLFVGVPTTRSDYGNEVFQFTNLGSGYTSSPSITFTDATAINKYAQAHVGYAVTGLTIADVGTGFTDGVIYSFDVYYDQIFDNGDGTTGTNVDQFYSGGVIDIEADVSGGFIQADIDAALAAAINSSDFFFDPANLATIADNVSNLRLISNGGTTDAVLTVSSSVGRLTDFQFEGDDISDPSFTFSGGGGTTQAVLEVDWASQWTFDLDNTNTSAYSQLPIISFEIFDAGTNPSSYDDNDVDVDDVNGNQVSSNQDLTNFLTLDGSGNIVSIDPTYSFETDRFSTQAPTVLVENPGPGTIASARADINSDGQVVGIFSINNGSGYTSPFQATIEPGAVGAPGTGASIFLFGGNYSGTGEFNWSNDYVMQSQGLDYLEELNAININGGNRSFSDGDNTQLVREGDVYIFNIDYGTGFRSTTYNSTN